MKELCKNCIKVLGGSSRMDVYYLILSNKRLSVNEVVKRSKVKQSTVSHHLKKLKDVGLINSKKEGKKVYYFINQTCPHYNEVCILQR